VEFVSDNLQLKKRIHELEQMRERVRYHGRLGQEELAEHQHSQQMGRTASVDVLLVEIGAPRMDGTQQGMAGRSGKNILRKMKRLEMLTGEECRLGVPGN